MGMNIPVRLGCIFSELNVFADLIGAETENRLLVCQIEAASLRSIMQVFTSRVDAG
jgi:hypothetical protein